MRVRDGEGLNGGEVQLLEMVGKKGVMSLALAVAAGFAQSILHRRFLHPHGISFYGEQPVWQRRLLTNNHPFHPWARPRCRRLDRQLQAAVTTR